jgi:hypothetical protein
MTNTPETVICRYSLKPGAEPEMLRLLAAHWPALHRAGLVTDEPSRVFRALPDTKRSAGSADLLVEIFTWRSGRSAERAHELPEIMAIWEPMGALCASMEFPHFEPLPIDFRA